MSKAKKMSIIFLSLSLVFLIIGASFHSLRMNRENEALFILGVNMGIAMISLFIIFLVYGISILIIEKNNRLELALPIGKILIGIEIIFTVIWGYPLSGGGEYMYELTCLSNLAGGILLILDGILYKKRQIGLIYPYVLTCILPVFFITVICTIFNIAHFNFSGGFFFMHAINPLVILAFFTFFYPVNKKRENIIVIFTSPLPILLFLLFDLIRFYIRGELIYGLIPKEAMQVWIVILIGLIVYALIAFLAFGLLSLRKSTYRFQERRRPPIKNES